MSKLAKMTCVLFWVRFRSAFCSTVVRYIRKELLSSLSTVEICLQNLVSFLELKHFAIEYHCIFCYFFCTLSDGRWHAMSFIIITVIYFQPGRRRSNLQGWQLVEAAAG